MPLPISNFILSLRRSPPSLFFHPSLDLLPFLLTPLVCGARGPRLGGIKVCVATYARAGEVRVCQEAPLPVKRSAVAMESLAEEEHDVSEVGGLVADVLERDFTEAQ